MHNCQCQLGIVSSELIDKQSIIESTELIRTFVLSWGEKT